MRLPVEFSLRSLQVHFAYRAAKNGEIYVGKYGKYVGNVGNVSGKTPFGIALVWRTQIRVELKNSYITKRSLQNCQQCQLVMRMY